MGIVKSEREIALCGRLNNVLGYGAILFFLFRFRYFLHLTDTLLFVSQKSHSKFKTRIIETTLVPSNILFDLTTLSLYFLLLVLVVCFKCVGPRLTTLSITCFSLPKKFAIFFLLHPNLKQNFSLCVWVMSEAFPILSRPFLIPLIDWSENDTFP